MTIQATELGALVKAGVFRSESEAMDEALRLLFVTQPQLKIEASVQMYQAGEVTLGRASEIAGLTRWEFESLLADRGIEIVVTSEPAQVLDQQFDQLQRQA